VPAKAEPAKEACSETAPAESKPVPESTPAATPAASTEAPAAAAQEEEPAVAEAEEGEEGSAKALSTRRTMPCTNVRLLSVFVILY
jgi:hypothetical protein